MKLEKIDIDKWCRENPKLDDALNKLLTSKPDFGEDGDALAALIEGHSTLEAVHDEVMKKVLEEMILDPKNRDGNKGCLAIKDIMININKRMAEEVMKDIAARIELAHIWLEKIASISKNRKDFERRFIEIINQSYREETP